MSTTKQNIRGLAALLLLLGSAGVGSGCSLIDFSRHTAGGGDAAMPRDAGPGVDAGPGMDAGPRVDAGQDAGPPPIDAGTDGGLPVLGPGSMLIQFPITESVVVGRGGSTAFHPIRDSGQALRIVITGITTGGENIYSTTPIGGALVHRDVTVTGIGEVEVTGPLDEASQATIAEVDFSLSSASSTSEEIMLNYVSPLDADGVSIHFYLLPFSGSIHYDLDVRCPNINRVAPGGNIPNHESFECVSGGTATLHRYDGDTENATGSGPAIIEYVKP